MKYPIYVIDAFASRQFSGNPAAVVLLKAWPTDRLLQAIAAENNLAETAFVKPTENGRWEIRWFTPTVEMPLCGHATLASAFVLLEHIVPERDEVLFSTRQSGNLAVSRKGSMLAMDLPLQPATIVQDQLVAKAIGEKPREVLKSEMFAVAVLDHADKVRTLAPDLKRIAEIDRRGLIVTAPGDEGFDCVSRYFAPGDGIDEDPVTGGAHTTIAPYWAERFGTEEILAYQASARGGIIQCKLKDAGRVELSGNCSPYLIGEIEV